MASTRCKFAEFISMIQVLPFYHDPMPRPHYHNFLISEHTKTSFQSKSLQCITIILDYANTQKYMSFHIIPKF